MAVKAVFPFTNKPFELIKCKMRRREEKKERTKEMCVLYFVFKNKKLCRTSLVSFSWMEPNTKQNKKSCAVLPCFYFFSFRLSNHLHFLVVPRDLVCDWGFRVSAQRKPPPSQLYVHRRHTLVEDLRSHQLHAGHDLLLVAHQRHAQPLDVPENRWRTR